MTESLTTKLRLARSTLLMLTCKKGFPGYPRSTSGMIVRVFLVSMTTRLFTSGISIRNSREAARKQKTNPYQIAKASGMSLTTVQRLLSIPANLPLLNIEAFPHYVDVPAGWTTIK